MYSRFSTAPGAPLAMLTGTPMVTNGEILKPSRPRRIQPRASTVSIGQVAIRTTWTISGFTIVIVLPTGNRYNNSPGIGCPSGVAGAAAPGHFDLGLLKAGIGRVTSSQVVRFLRRVAKQPDALFRLIESQ